MNNKKTLLILSLILIATAILFSPILHNDFVNWDDPEFLTDNVDVRELSFANTIEIFRKHLTGEFAPVLPLSIFTYSLEYHFFGYSPLVVHLNNLILHLFNSALVFIFVQILFRHNGLALLTCFFFAIHPMHVEPVAWASSRKDVLFTFFYMLSLIAYLKFQFDFSKNKKSYVLSLFLFFLSLLSKGVAVTLPVVLIALLPLIKNTIDWRKEIVKLLPFFTLSVLFGCITLYANDHSLNWSDAFLATSSYSYLQKILLSSYALCVYVFKFIWPWPMLAIYPFPIIDGQLILETYLSLACIILFAVLIFKLRNKFPSVVFGSLFFVITIFPVLHLIEVNDSIIYDRFAYLPYLGLSLLLSYGLIAFWDKRQKILPMIRIFLVVVVFLFVMVLSIFTFQQSHIWRNNEYLWSHVMKHFPQAAVAYHNLGVHYTTQQKFPLALALFDRAIELKPDDAVYHYSRGLGLEKIGDRMGAIQSYSNSISKNSEQHNALHNRGSLYWLNGQTDLALQDYTNAITVKPNYINTIVNRGMLYYHLGELDSAREDLNRAKVLAPNDPKVLDNLQIIDGEK